MGALICKHNRQLSLCTICSVEMERRMMVVREAGLVWDVKKEAQKLMEEK